MASQTENVKATVTAFLNRATLRFEQQSEERIGDIQLLLSQLHFFTSIESTFERFKSAASSTEMPAPISPRALQFRFSDFEPVLAAQGTSQPTFISHF